MRLVRGFGEGREEGKEKMRFLGWVSKGEVEDYMSQHRQSADISELVNYFNTVIDWASTTFSGVKSQMCGLEWGRLYETYHTQSYNAAEVWQKVEALFDSDFIKAKAGIFEYVLGGEQDTKLLQVRVFDDHTKRKVWKRQTEEAKTHGVSNCPLCAIGNNSNKNRIWELKEMDADHVTAWSKGGATDESNCEMLCQTHNRAKGNK